MQALHLVEICTLVTLTNEGLSFWKSYVINFLCKYCKKVITVALDYRNNDRLAFVTTSTMTINFQWCKYCKLGINAQLMFACKDNDIVS